MVNRERPGRGEVAGETSTNQQQLTLLRSCFPSLCLWLAGIAFGSFYLFLEEGTLPPGGCKRRQMELFNLRRQKLAREAEEENGRCFGEHWTNLVPTSPSSPWRPPPSWPFCPECPRRRSRPAPPEEGVCPAAIIHGAHRPGSKDHPLLLIVPFICPAPGPMQ